MKRIDNLETGVAVANPNVVGWDVPGDDDFMRQEDLLGELWVCVMCGFVVADRFLHREFHRWMLGTARRIDKVQ